MSTLADPASEKQGQCALVYNPCPYGIISAMNKAVRVLEASAGGWIYQTPDQEEFLRIVYGPHSGHGVDGIPEIETIAARTAKEINQFLQERGFDIRLREIQDPRGFGVAAVLDVMEEFACAGDADGRIIVSRMTQKHYPAVRMKPFGFKVMQHQNLDKLLFVIRTVGGDQIMLTELGHDVVYDFIVNDDYSEFRQLEDGLDFVFPMVDYCQEADISPLCGLRIDDPNGDQFFITQALQENRLQMNQFGCRAQSATAIAMARSWSMPREPHKIDGPFSVFICRSGLKLPLFAIRVEEEHWKNPGEFSDK